ncbi:MAG: hydroxymethylpyrimidine/phosphomethylpyrimidine kinase [Mesorhizobium sp.]|uniref:hydroxymethylpyrimidine/phosphomethylpyrimidine kinase n=1 Tax=Mesorhizobium sp. TaxID=1871066 RepID=UPI000FE9CBC6|nr:hydroxymethylpyrimidine/phosphomethylpyrimidine kinase [Mesorhizobium sp.]RWE28293.1 MAG: hydroxymethylpyrimidine/phosphomethylpyrimidine kinase [Mesorhizobium sp.]RWE42234.1 MAG: hydroxymethylpyrimidine/phosphomethylpyrimidine kinase [Mesorhizobium sp.]
MALSQNLHVLVVGGSDSSGGAGIARDVETISSIGLRTCLAVTAVTVQTHGAINDILHLQPGLVADQMRAALQANVVAAIKIGMLATAPTIAAIAAVLSENPQIPAILDPVLASSSGRPLVEPNAVDLMKRDLIPLCRLVTPNLVELAVLTGSELAAGDDDALRQGRRLLPEGPQALLIKGGHAEGPRSTDILLSRGREPIRFDMPRLAGSMRGTGCILASAIAAYLATGDSIEKAVLQAKLLVFEKISKNPM